MGLYREIEVKRLFYRESVAAGTTSYATTMDLGDFIQGGTFSIQYEITSAAATTVEFGYKLANVLSDLVFSSDGHVIVTGVGSTSGVAANGKDVLVFTPTMARFMQVYAFNTGGNSATVSLWFAGQ